MFKKLKKDVIKAMKDRDELCRDLLRVLIGDVSKETKEPSDAQVVAMVKKFCTNINEKVLPHLEEHTTAWDKAKTEVAILEEYLPKQLDETAIRAILEPFKSKGLGVAMKHFKENYEGQYDGKLVSQIAKGIV